MKGRRLLSWCLIIVMIIAITPLASIPAEAANTYDAQKAVAWASNDTIHRQYSTNATRGTNHEILCAEYVCLCLQQGGMPVPTYTTPGNVMNWVVDHGYGTKYEMTDANLKKLEAGDFIVITCDAGHGYDICGLHTIFITSVDQANKKLTYSANNTDKYNAPFTFTELKNYRVTCGVNKHNSTAQNHLYIVHTNKKATTPTPLNLGNDFYAYLVAQKAWKHIAVKDRNVELAKTNDNYDPAQIWRFVRQSDGSYKVRNMWWEGQEDTSWTLEVYKSGTGNGTNVDVWKESNSTNARWFIYDKGNGYYMMVPAHSSKSCLDVTGNSSKAGTNIQLYQQADVDAQLIGPYYLKNDNITYKKPGKPAAPKYSGPTSGTTGEALTLSWAASAKVNSFDKRSYTLKVTDSSGNAVVNKSGLTATTYKFTPSKAGNYTVAITAVNDYYKDYASSATKATLKVSDKVIAVDRVEISNAEMNLKKGQTGNLTVSVIPDIATNKAVTWSSSDPNVATVDNNGKVTAVNKGMAVITVTAGGKSDSCDVTVQESSSGNIPVTSVTLDKISLVMKEGDTEKLTPTVLPSNATQKTVSWSSSDTGVASVDGSGNVTAKKEGTATITVHAEGKTATCQVTVKKEGSDTVPIDSIEVSKTALTMTEGETTSIAVTIKPVEAAKNNVQATNSNGNVIHISAGAGSSTPNVYNVKIEAKQAGTATITFTGDGKSAECKVTVKEKSSTKPVEETEQHGVNCASAKYTDVNRSESNWTHLPIDYALEKGYMAGISANRFDPNGTVTRAQIVQILYAKEGKPATSGARIFGDVPAGQWYTNAIEWASRNKVVAGYTDGTFKPNQAITREQMVTILRAYAGYKGMDTAANGNVNSFPDSGKISNYAQQAMKWAVGNKLIGGTGKGIEPQGTATRAQIAVILKAYDQNIG